MGLFGRLFSNNKIEIGSPVNGEIVPITDVQDPTFSEEMVGKGVAIIPSDGKFYSPADGKLIALFPTGHAYAINTDSGAEILVHIGLDTVELNGEYYKVNAKQGNPVKKGDLIVEVDLEGIKNAGYDVITPLIVSNHANFSKLEKKSGKISALEPAIILSK